MEENMLKLKYNELLARYNKGAEYLAKNPNDEKAMEEFNKISDELNNIIEALPNMTNEEKTEGFNIEAYANVEEPKENASIIPASKVANAPVNVSNAFDDFGSKWQIAEKLCKSSIIPKEFQNKPENVLLCMGMSDKMGLDVITVMNNLQLVMGKQEWKGSFIPVLIERTGKYCDLEFNFVGTEGKNDFGCYLEATRVRDGKRIKGTTITMEMAKAEGWYNRNSKWQTMGRQLLIYRASTFFARAYCAGALNGISTEGEVSDINNRKQPQDIL